MHFPIFLEILIIMEWKTLTMYVVTRDLLDLIFFFNFFFCLKLMYACLRPSKMQLQRPPQKIISNIFISISKVI